jgi:hypothetical protein
MAAGRRRPTCPRWILARVLGARGRHSRERAVTAASPPVVAVLHQQQQSSASGSRLPATVSLQQPRSSRSAPPSAAPGLLGCSLTPAAAPRCFLLPDYADGRQSPESEGYPAVLSQAVHPNRQK